jgi:hypothetical protein
VRDPRIGACGVRVVEASKCSSPLIGAGRGPPPMASGGAARRRQRGQTAGHDLDRLSTEPRQGKRAASERQARGGPGGRPLKRLRAAEESEPNPGLGVESLRREGQRFSVAVIRRWPRSMSKWHDLGRSVGCAAAGLRSPSGLVTALIFLSSAPGPRPAESRCHGRCGGSGGCGSGAGGGLSGSGGSGSTGGTAGPGSIGGSVAAGRTEELMNSVMGPSLRRPVSAPDAPDITLLPVATE